MEKKVPQARDARAAPWVCLCYAMGVSRLCLAAFVLVALACSPSEPSFHAARGEHASPETPPDDRSAHPGGPGRERAPRPRTEGTGAGEPTQLVAGAPSHGGWNESQIHWEPYEAGLERARRESRPVLLVFSASWCGHCRTYSHVFEDPRIVASASRFVMVRVDSDARRDVAALYALDGGYVPRTYFLQPDGAPMADVTANHPRFRYFFDENDPASLLAGMTQALTRVGG